MALSPETLAAAEKAAAAQGLTIDEFVRRAAGGEHRDFDASDPCRLDNPGHPRCPRCHRDVFNASRIDAPAGAVKGVYVNCSHCEHVFQII